MESETEYEKGKFISHTELMKEFESSKTINLQYSIKRYNSDWTKIPTYQYSAWTNEAI